MFNPLMGFMNFFLCMERRPSIAEVLQKLNWKVLVSMVYYLIIRVVLISITDVIAIVCDTH